MAFTASTNVMIPFAASGVKSALVRFLVNVAGKSPGAAKSENITLPFVPAGPKWIWEAVTGVANPCAVKVTLMLVLAASIVTVAAVAYPLAAAGGLGAKAGADAIQSMPAELTIPPLAQTTYVYASDGKTLLTEFYDEKTNRLKPPAELASIATTLPAGPAVTYCNTGHWAATDWFVLSEILGRADVRLYYGSMVDWTSDASRPLASARTKWDDLKKTLGFGS